MPRQPLTFARQTKRHRRAAREAARCKAHPCCTRPAPVSFVELAHGRGEDVAAMAGEVWWWLECWSCGRVCACEV